MNPVSTVLLAVFLIVFLGIIAYVIITTGFFTIRDSLHTNHFHTNRNKRLSAIQEQWRQIDHGNRGDYFGSNQELGERPRHWKATSMTWVMRPDGWKGWGRSWVDDD